MGTRLVGPGHKSGVNFYQAAKHQTRNLRDEP
jgi:hypothetical protein